MLSIKEINNLKEEINFSTSLLNKDMLFSQAQALQKHLIKEVNSFNENKEYLEVCTNLTKCTEKKFIYHLPDILDTALRLFIHEIYILEKEAPVLNILNNIYTLTSKIKTKFFQQAQEIAQKTLNMYYLTKLNDKKIVNLIDELLPESYINDDEINFVLWYFIVCIVAYYNISIEKKN